MKVLKEEVVQQVAKGYEFSYKSHDGYSYTIRVDSTGNVTFADYGSMNGWCSKSTEDWDFESAVRMAMNGILENDKEEFKKMRSHLNDKFRDIAENVRRSKMSDWDF